MSAEDKNREIQPTAPLYPQVNSDNEGPQAPPPPYYQPLPPLNPQVTTPTTIYVPGPMNPSLLVGSGPSRLRCPNCHGEIVTKTQHKSGCLTWAICGSICAIGLFAPCAWLGCQFIPFCIDSCKDVQHSCPNCRAYIGTFDRMK